MNHMKKKFAALGCMACLSLSVLSCPIAALPVQAAIPEEEAVMPMSDDIRWVYNSVDGKLYKRLYNYSTDTWIGDWIYVCDLPKKSQDPSPGKHEKP